MTQEENTTGFAGFLREHRGNEANFEMIYKRFEKEASSLSSADAIRTKADVYRKAKEQTGSAWPEFEAFITELEKAVVQKEG